MMKEFDLVSIDEEDVNNNPLINSLKFAINSV